MYPADRRSMPHPGSEHARPPLENTAGRGQACHHLPVGHVRAAYSAPVYVPLLARPVLRHYATNCRVPVQQYVRLSPPTLSYQPWSRLIPPNRRNLERFASGGSDVSSASAAARWLAEMYL